MDTLKSKLVPNVRCKLSVQALFSPITFCIAIGRYPYLLAAQKVWEPGVSEKIEGFGIGLWGAGVWAYQLRVNTICFGLARTPDFLAEGSGLGVALWRFGCLERRSSVRGEGCWGSHMRGLAPARKVCCPKKILDRSQDPTVGRVVGPYGRTCARTLRVSLHPFI